MGGCEIKAADTHAKFVILNYLANDKTLPTSWQHHVDKHITWLELETRVDFKKKNIQKKVLYIIRCMSGKGCRRLPEDTVGMGQR